MSQKFVVLKDRAVEQGKWMELISKSHFSTPFQTPAFFNLCNRTPSHKGIVCAIEGDDHTYHAVCVVDIINERGAASYFSRRAIVYGGPLILNENRENALHILLENLHNELKNKVIYIEIRNFKDYSDYASVFFRLGWQYVPWLNCRKKLNYPNSDQLLSSFRYNRRREIRSTLKAGLAYHEAENENEIYAVYNILKKLYRRKTGLPLPDFSYFIDFRNTGLMKIFTVSDKGVIVGGSFCVIMENEAIFTFYYCGERNHKPQVFPSHLAVLAAMEFGIKNGLKYIDFMGAGKPGKEYGVRNYKLEFGSELNEEGRYLKIEKKLLYKLGVKVINFRKNRKLRTIKG